MVEGSENITMTYKDAAKKVLELHSNEKMHYRDITKEALDLKLIISQAPTPSQTMRSRMGDFPEIFERLGSGYYRLLEVTGLEGRDEVEISHITEPVIVDNRLKDIHIRYIQDIIKYLQDINPADFEKIIGQLLNNVGFESVEVTRYSGDGGIDVRGVMMGDIVQTKVAIQAKRLKNNVQKPVVQQLRGSLGAHEHGLIITTSDFSKGAIAEAEREDADCISLMNGEQLVEKLIEFKIICTYNSKPDGGLSKWIT